MFGTPTHELTNVLTEFSELIGNRAEQLAERLAQAPTWPARFDLLDDLLPGWIQRQAPHSRTKWRGHGSGCVSRLGVSPSPS